VRWGGLPLLILLLALPPSWGDDTKDGKKDGSAKERYEALLKDFTTQQRETLAELRKLSGEEQQKLIQKYTGLAREYTEKFYKIAEDDPKDPAATDALFWVLQNGTGSPVHAKAAEKVTALVGEMPLKDLAARLNTTRIANPALLAAVVKRAEKDAKEPQAGDLVGWAATTGAAYPDGKKAAALLVEKYPDNPAIERLCMTLARTPSPDAQATLKQIMEKSSKANVKASAAYALGQAIASKLDQLGDKPAEADKAAAEAEKYLEIAIENFGKDNPQAKNAEMELKGLRTLRIGKEAPEITAPDLDGKDFKLSDYRGKVVLLDFWGNW
jgi:hypothetical protein